MEVVRSMSVEDAARVADGTRGVAKPRRGVFIKFSPGRWATRALEKIGQLPLLRYTGKRLPYGLVIEHENRLHRRAEGQNLVKKRLQALTYRDPAIARLVH